MVGLCRARSRAPERDRFEQAVARAVKAEVDKKAAKLQMEKAAQKEEDVKAAIVQSLRKFVADYSKGQEEIKNVLKGFG